MKKALLMALCVLGIATTTLASASTINTYFDGDKIAYTDAVPYVQGNRVMIPFRVIGEALGMNVQWEESTKTVVAFGNRQPWNKPSVLEMTYGKDYMVFDGKAKNLDTQIVIKNGRTYVPVRAFTESFGWAVNYINGEVHITYPEWEAPW